MLGRKWRPLPAFTPDSLATLAWVGLFLFLGGQIGASLMAALRVDPVYFCSTGADCRANNVRDLKCCRDLLFDDDLKTPTYTCRPECR